MTISLAVHTVKIVNKVPIVDGIGVRVNERFEDAGAMRGMVDMVSHSMAVSAFGIDTTRGAIFYTNDQRAETLEVGQRLEEGDRVFSVKARPRAQTALLPIHYEVMLEEVPR